MKKIEIDFENAAAIVNGCTFNPILTEKQIIDKMGIDEYLRIKSIRDQYPRRQSQNMSLALYMCTFGGVGEVKCNDFNDFSDCMNSKGNWNEFVADDTIRTLKKYFGQFKKYYGENNPNQSDAFEFWISGDYVFIKIHTYSSDVSRCFDPITQEAFEYNPEDYMKSLTNKIKKDTHADVCEVFVDENLGMNWKEVTFKLWWD